jgi:hypothetical protein
MQIGSDSRNELVNIKGAIGRTNQANVTGHEN